MKKIVQALMAVLVAIPALYSCAEKELLEPAVQTEPVEVPRYAYRFEIADDETRAVFNDEGVFWESGDQVGLFLGSGNSIVADVNTESSPKTIEFSTSAPLESQTLIHAYYPFQENNASVSASKVVFPRNQQGGSVSAMPMAGIPTVFQEGESNGVIRFRNLGSILDFRVYSASHTAERIQSIQLSVSGSNPISGEATLDLTGVTREDETSMALTWPQGASEASSVTLLQAATIAASKEQATEPLYLVVAPGTYSGSIVVVTDAASYTFTLPSLAFDRNLIKRINMNLDGSKVVRRSLDVGYQKITSADQLTTGEDEYLIVYESGSKAFKPILSGNNALNNSASNVFGVTIDDGHILATEQVDACRVVFESAGSGQYYMKAVAVGNYYFYPTSNGIGATTNQRNATAVSVDFVSGTGGTVNIQAGSNFFKYSTSSNCFKQSNYNSSRELALYKRVGKDGLKPQSLQFTPASVRISLDGQTLPFTLTDAPVLSGLETQVAYWQSSDPDVAVVDNSGTVQVKDAGVTVITAVAEPDANYAGGSASYRLTVLGNGLFSVENDKVATYLDLVDAHPYNPPADYSFTHMSAELQNGNTNQTNRLDWPKPVPIQWTTSVSGTPTVIVYDESGQEDKTANVTVTSSTSADIYSLIPGRSYTYVVRNGQTQIGEGGFRTVGRRRMIKVADSPYGRAYANNCRDFGGQITSDGRRIKYGKLFRGSNMDKVTNAQYTYLRQFLNIGLDVDLRANTSGSLGSGDEMLNDPLGLNEGHTSETFGSWSDFANPKSNGTYKMTTILTKIFATVDAGKGVYIHCKVGADRTGYVCMLLEAILGVRQGLCDVDYELTSFSGAVDDGIGRWRVGAYSSGGQTLSNNWYYRTRNNTVQGVDYIYNLSVGDFGTVYPNNAFQAKVVNYVVNTLGIPFTTVQAFQNNMLEDLN